jgi:hypothetical protein
MTQYSDTGELLTQSKIIEKELASLDRAIVSTDDDGMPPRILIPIKDLVSYVLEQRAEDFFNGEQVGRLQGHKESGVMFLAAFEAELGGRPTPLSPSGYKWAVEAAKRAVEVISKSLEEKT